MAAAGGLSSDVEQTRRRRQPLTVEHARPRVREDRRRVLPRVTQRLHRPADLDRNGVLRRGHSRSRPVDTDPRPDLARGVRRSGPAAARDLSFKSLI